MVERPDPRKMAFVSDEKIVAITVYLAGKRGHISKQLLFNVISQANGYHQNKWQRTVTGEYTQIYYSKNLKNRIPLGVDFMINTLKGYWNPDIDLTRWIEVKDSKIFLKPHINPNSGVFLDELSDSDQEFLDKACEFWGIRVVNRGQEFSS
jgi:hypothetical protein